MGKIPGAGHGDRDEQGDQAHPRARGLLGCGLPGPGLVVVGTHPPTGTDGKEMHPLIAEGLDAIERANLANAAKRELTSMFVDNLIYDAARRAPLP